MNKEEIYVKNSMNKCAKLISKSQKLGGEGGGVILSKVMIVFVKINVLLKNDNNNNKNIKNH